VSDHQRRATRLPGNTTPDVDENPLPGHYGSAIHEFLLRLAQVRGTYGRDQIRAVELTGWRSFGADLDHLDGLASEYRNRTKGEEGRDG
jgi:hypothetical protein